jgi:cystathionine gamma-synthase
MSDGDEFETRAVHAGQEPDATGAVVPPISLASTFVQDAVGEHRGYEYARSANPTRAALETCIAELEEASHGLAFASGMAAEDVVLRAVLSPGDHVIIPADAYGGTCRLVARVYEPAGIDWTAVDLCDLDALAVAWRDETKLVWAETPTNPLLSVVDIAAVANAAHERDALIVVDNTFATPYLQLPLTLGADVVLHSSTKYLGGHSDVVGGLVALDDDELTERMAFVQNAAGAVPGPIDCYLVRRGVKTLAVRMDRHCANARAVAALLAEHPAVDRVLYPGLPGHPGHDVARRQMHDFGGMVSFTVAGGEDAALELVASTRLFALAESLGAVESLIEHPARMTHASVAGSALAVDPSLVRLSVGIESAEDLVADLRHALDALR